MYGGLPVAIPLSVPLLASLQLPFGVFWVSPRLRSWSA